MPAQILSSPEPSSVSRQGKAFDTERNQPAYTEERVEHFINGTLSSTETKFATTQGKHFANLTLDFSRFSFKPDYNFKDFRNGYEEGARVEIKPNGAIVHTYFQDSTHAPRKEKALVVPEPCVINGGVGEIVKTNWSEISAGKKIPFNLVVPARLDYYKFVAYEDKKFQVSAKETGNVQCRPIVIESKNSLLAMLLPTLVMYYDPKTLKMNRYQGIVNIADSKGRSLRVRIDYPP